MLSLQGVKCTRVTLHNITNIFQETACYKVSVFLAFLGFNNVFADTSTNDRGSRIRKKLTWARARAHRVKSDLGSGS